MPLKPYDFVPNEDGEMERLSELQRRTKRSAAAQRVFSGADGELILEEVRKFCGSSLIFDVNKPDPTTTIYNVGKRDVLIFIEKMLSGDVEKAREILNAQTEKRREQE